MNKKIVLSLLLTIGFISCKNSEKEIDRLKIAKQYYTALDNSDDSEIVTLLTDSIVVRETEYDYEEVFSQKGYVEWLKWDSVFNPTYEIIQIRQKDEIVEAEISKKDKRISFLHEEPIVWNEIIQFDNDKIIRVERTYEIFNDTVFIKNRDSLLNWIDKNHPELNGFLNKQTETVGKKYLKAIELYKNKK